MTIYALSSGPGISGIAVIRISGPETKNVIEEMTKEQIPEPRLASLRKLKKINTKELICSDQKKTCEFLTESNSKIMFDSSHFTVEGAKYLGAKIKELKWF